VAITTPPTLKASSGSTTDGTTFTTAAVAFITGRVYLLALEYSNGIGANPPPPSSVVTTGVTWTQITHLQYKTSATNRTACALYWGVGSAVSQTTAINFAATATGCRWIMSEWVGVHTTTPYATGNVKTSTPGSIAVGGTMTVTLDAFTSVASRSFAMMGANINDTAMDCDVDWTQLDEHVHANPSEIIQAAWSTNQTAFTETNNTAQINFTGIIAIELLPAPVSSTLGRGQETDLGRTPVLSKAVTLARGSTAAFGRALTLVKSLTLGRAQEADLGRAVTFAKGALTLARATEADTGRALTVTSAATLGRGQETDAARALTVAKALTLGRANEVDAGRALSITTAVEVTLGRAVETDAGRALTVGKAVTLGQASEADSARALTITKTHANLRRAFEIDLVPDPALEIAKTLVLGRAVEVDSGRALTATLGVTVTLGRAQETDSGRILSLVKSVILGRAGEVDAARALSRGRSVTLGRAGEVDTARALTVETVTTDVPPEHTYHVPAETRLLVVLADPRTLHVPPDDRSDTAPIRADFTVPEDTRLVSA
jgi:hypothetical protein